MRRKVTASWRLVEAEEVLQAASKAFPGEDAGGRSVAAVRKGLFCHVGTGLLFTAMGLSSHRLCAIAIFRQGLGLWFSRRGDACSRPQLPRVCISEVVIVVACVLCDALSLLSLSVQELSHYGRGFALARRSVRSPCWDTATAGLLLCSLQVALQKTLCLWMLQCCCGAGTPVSALRQTSGH